MFQSSRFSVKWLVWLNVVRMHFRRLIHNIADAQQEAKELFSGDSSNVVSVRLYHCHTTTQHH